jgi:hypothetical protein
MKDNYICAMAKATHRASRTLQNPTMYKPLTNLELRQIIDVINAVIHNRGNK